MRSERRRDAWYDCSTQSLRAFLVPVVPAHPTTMAWGLARRLIAQVQTEGWLPPRGVVCDPLAGSGATGLAWSMCGVRSILGELEAHVLAALAATVARHRPRWLALGSPMPHVLRHDTRHLPLRQVEVIISSPPYPGMVHARNHIDTQKLRATHTERTSQARAVGSGTHRAQIGRLRLADTLQARMFVAPTPQRVSRMFTWPTSLHLYATADRIPHLSTYSLPASDDQVLCLSVDV